jgi:hypothetical protein
MMFPGERRAGDEGAMGHRIAAADNRPPRPERSLASRLVIAISILLVVAGLLFLGWVYAIGQLLGEPALEGLQIANRTDQRLTIYWVSEAPYEGKELQFDAIDAHTTRTIADDCASLEMIARAPDGTEVARRGPFDQCNLKTWVIREPAT